MNPAYSKNDFMSFKVCLWAVQSDAVVAHKNTDLKKDVIYGFRGQSTIKIIMDVKVIDFCFMILANPYQQTVYFGSNCRNS